MLRKIQPIAGAAALMLLLGLPRATAAQHHHEPAAGAAAAVRAQPAYTAADVRFMQHMITHHAQALEMTALVPERSERREIQLLAERIEVSQVDEIALMRQWLSARGEDDPGQGQEQGHGHGHGAGEHAMPGMLTTEEMARLAAARGDEFDRLFLESMIKHHEGALTMVADLFGTPGGGQEPVIFRFASDVDADQRVEIERMRGMLEALGAAAGAGRGG